MRTNRNFDIRPQPRVLERNVCAYFCLALPEGRFLLSSQISTTNTNVTTNKLIHMYSYIILFSLVSFFVDYRTFRCLLIFECMSLILTYNFSLLLHMSFIPWYTEFRGMMLPTNTGIHWKQMNTHNCWKLKWKPLYKWWLKISNILYSNRKDTHTFVSSTYNTMEKNKAKNVPHCWNNSKIKYQNSRKR